MSAICGSISETHAQRHASKLDAPKAPLHLPRDVAVRGAAQLLVLLHGAAVDAHRARAARLEHLGKRHRRRRARFEDADLHGDGRAVELAHHA